MLSAAIALFGMVLGAQGAVAVLDGPETGAAAQVSGTQVDRMTPVDSEVTVAPGTDLLFEVAVTDYPGTSPQVTWYVDGERRWSEYPAVSSRPHVKLHDVSSGTHMVTGIVRGEDGEDELGTVAWVVHVEDGADGAPSLSRANPEEEQVEVPEGESRDFTLRADDAGGDLHRVLWFAGMCDDPLGGTAVDSTEDEATLTYEPSGCGVVGGWVVDERGAINSAGLSGLTSWSVETTETETPTDTPTETETPTDTPTDTPTETPTETETPTDTPTETEDDNSEEWHTITFDGQSTSSRTDYSFSVSGSIEAEEGIGTGDSIDGSSATGFVRGGSDVYRFSGDLESHDVSGGDGLVYVDGEPVDG